MAPAGGEFVGRADECARMLRVLDSPGARTSAALVLTGVPGVGKSALLEWMIAEAGDRTVLRGTGSLRNMSAPFSLLEALMHSPAAADTLTAGSRRWSGPDEGVGDGGPVDRFAVAMDIFERLSARAESQPVLVVVDDAQWADASSLDALLLALPHLRDDEVAMVFARRDGEPCLLDDTALPTLEVTGLAPLAVCALLDGVVDAAVARQLADHTAGNPLALLELADLLDPDERNGSVAISPSLLRTPTVEAGFLQRVEALPGDARNLLEMACIDTAIEPTVLIALSGDPEHARHLIALLEQRGFLRLDHHERFLEFTHPLLRTAVYSSLEPGARRQMHRDLASILRRDADVTRRAWHLEGASDGPDETAAVELQRAGEYSKARGAYAVAAETFTRSADLTSDEGCRTDRLLAAGDAYWLAGRVERSAAVLDLALALAPDQLKRADVQLTRIATQRTRSFSDMFDELTLEAEATRAADPDRAAMLLAQAVMPGMMALRYEEARSSAGRALDLLDDLHPVRMVAELLRVLVSNLLGDTRDTARVLREFVDVFDAVGPGPQFAGLAEYTALLMMSGDDVTTASRLLDSMIDYARRESTLGLLPLPLSARAELRWRCGSWPAALADATESFAIVNETAQYIERGHTLTILGKINGGMGHFEHARGLLDDAFAVADTCDCSGLRVMGFSALAFIELTAGALEPARRHLLALRAYSSQCGDRLPTLWPWRAELVEVASALGDRGLAEDASAQLDRDAALFDTAQAHALAARGRGIVATDESAARESFEQSVELFEGLPFSFERARTQLLYGEYLLQHADERATAALTSCVRTFDELGAHPWSERARAHLPRVARGLPTTPFECLTERELQVAVAVSTGRTNIEAASELFLSRRTVENHLAAIYRKLDIRNRTELAALLATPDDGTSGSPDS